MINVIASSLNFSLSEFSFKNTKFVSNFASKLKF